MVIKYFFLFLFFTSSVVAHEVAHHCNSIDELRRIYYTMDRSCISSRCKARVEREEASLLGQIDYIQACEKAKTDLNKYERFD